RQLAPDRQRLLQGVLDLRAGGLVADQDLDGLVVAIGQRHLRAEVPFLADGQAAVLPAGTMTSNRCTSRAVSQGFSLLVSLKSGRLGCSINTTRSTSLRLATV